MMKKVLPLIITIAGVALLFAGAGLADASAPPVNQTIGMGDVSIGAMEEADCRVCHDSGVPDKHHLLYGQPIPPGSVVPNPGGSVYGCLSCHDQDTSGGVINFLVERNCVVCHTTSAHHTTPTAKGGNCVACHGDVIDDMDDGHYIPVYAASMVTPKRSGGTGLPLNSRNNGAGACNYCHDNDGLPTPVILTNMELHHGTGLVDDPGFPTACDWCHDFGAPMDEQIRTCEGCHGPESLHNIQADSPNTDNLGTLVVGGEDAGYGHVGRDAGSADSDCWGCHGFSVASAPSSGPITPSIDSVDPTVIVANTVTQLTITGSGFTNTMGLTEYTSFVRLTTADGNTIDLTPATISEGELTVVFYVPAAYVGNYPLQVVKEGVNASGAVVITVKPPVEISDTTCAECTGVVTINGEGFGDAPPEGVQDYINVMMDAGVELEIISWTDTQIEVSGGCDAESITVNALFGSATR